jgi:uncharacterized protein YqeY
MSIKAKLAEDLKSAMRAKDVVRLETIRAVRAAITQREVDGGRDLDDAAVFEIVRSLRKQRIESIEQYRAGGREDLAERERSEQELLEAYLPQAPTREEMESAVRSAIALLEAKSIKDMSRVMQAAREQLSGADGKVLSDVVRALLASPAT